MVSVFDREEQKNKASAILPSPMLPGLVSFKKFHHIALIPAVSISSSAVQYKRQGPTISLYKSDLDAFQHIFQTDDTGSCMDNKKG